jgi:hypothetical protein
MDKLEVADGHVEEALPRVGSLKRLADTFVTNEGFKRRLFLNQEFVV